MGLVYMPQIRPGLAVEQVMEEDLVLVASWPNPTLDFAGRYVFVDWGPEFMNAHSRAFPKLTNPGMTFSLGAMVAEYVINRQAAAYLPARYVKKYLDSGQLHLVPDAPVFPYPVWAVWREDMDAEILQAATKVIVQVGQNAETDSDTVLDDLRAISEVKSQALDGQT